MKRLNFESVSQPARDRRRNLSIDPNRHRDIRTG
jgi:hypothetical protein